MITGKKIKEGKSHEQFHGTQEQYMYMYMLT